MQRKKDKKFGSGKKGDRWLIITVAILILFFGGIWVGKFIYNKNNTICEAAAYGTEKATNKNIVTTASKDKKTEEELKKKEELAKQEELKKEEAAKAAAENKDIYTSNNYSYSVNVEDAYKNDGKKIAFLTFDDGPTRNITPQVLDTLKKYDIKATFFLLGKMAEQNKDLVKKIVNEGHAIANHSYSHDYNGIYASSESFWGEINKTNGILKDILGQEFNTRIFRFPGGSSGGSYEKSKAIYRKEMKEKGYLYVDWNAEDGDGKSNNFTPETLLQYVKETTSGHEHIVVLMHDSATKQTTAQALPRIIEYLKAQGYEFKVLR